MNFHVAETSFGVWKIKVDKNQKIRNTMFPQWWKMHWVSPLHGGMKYSTLFFAYWSITPLSTMWTLSSGMVCPEHADMWRMEWGLCSGVALLLSLCPGDVHLGTAAPSLKSLPLQSPHCRDGSIPKGNEAGCVTQIAHSLHRWSVTRSPLTMKTYESSQLCSTEAMLLWEKVPCLPAPLIPATRRQDRISLPSLSGF